MRTALPNRCATNSPRSIQRRTVRVETPRRSATVLIVQKVMVFGNDKPASFHDRSP